MLNPTDIFDIVKNKRAADYNKVPCRLGMYKTHKNVKKDPYVWVDSEITTCAKLGYSTVYFSEKEIFTGLMDFYDNKMDYLEAKTYTKKTGHLWWKKTFTKTEYSWGPGYENHGVLASNILTEICYYLDNSKTRWIQDIASKGGRYLAVEIYPS